MTYELHVPIPPIRKQLCAIDRYKYIVKIRSDGRNWYCFNGSHAYWLPHKLYVPYFIGALPYMMMACQIRSADF